MGSMVTGATGCVLAALQSGSGMDPLPASPPIGGVLWTVVVPTLLFVGSFLGTYLLYRRFAGEGE